MGRRVWAFGRAKSQLRRVRLSRVVNVPLTSALRKAGLRSEFWLRHLPRVGVVTIALPMGQPVRMFSEADDWITSRLWWRGWLAVEPASVRIWAQMCRSSSVVIDAGAHTGYFSLIAHAVGADEVYAFEPHPVIANRCAMNAALNSAPIVVIPAALADFNGTADLRMPPGGLPSGSSLVRDPEGFFVLQRVRVKTLDAFVEEWDLGKVDAIKLDVEGAELSVLRGADRTLHDYRPSVLFEVIQDCVFTPGLTDLLTSLGYTLWKIDENQVHQVSEVTPPLVGFVNYLATTRGSDLEKFVAELSH
jgi:FkbM family methyltransferase